MKKPSDNRFRTHIPEPRWQQIVSVGFVVLIIIIWIIAATWHHH